MRTYWWHRLETSIIHCGRRVVVDYEVCNDYDSGRQFYTGRSKMEYVPAQ